MNVKRLNVYQTIKKRVILLMAIMMLVIIGIIVASMIMASTLKNASSMVNVLGRQRMYTQSIAKNASRISVLYSAKDSEAHVQATSVLEGKLTTTKGKLLIDRAAFENILRALEFGQIVVDNTHMPMDKAVMEVIDADLEALTQLWGPYSDAITVIANSSEINTAFREALITINENNELLLYYTQDITNTYDAMMRDNYLHYRNITYGLIGMLVVLAFSLVYFLYSYLFSALNVFYSEIEKLGIDHDHPTQSRRDRSLSSEIKRLLLGFTETLELVEKINASGSFSETLQYIYKSFSHYLPYTYIGIALLTDTVPQRVIASYGIGEEHHPGLAKELLNNEVALSETSLGEIMETLKPRVINDYDVYFKTHTMKEYSRIIMKHGIKSSITLPLRANEVPLGFIFFSSNQKNVYESRHIEYLKLISNSIALSFDKNIFSEELVYSGVLALAKLSEARDEDTGEHLMRMSKYVEILAEALGETDEYRNRIDHTFVTNIVKFSPMHDIGKVGVPDNILLKPGKLTDDEFEIMKTHTLYGANVLSEAEMNVKRGGRSLFGMGISIALHHHEKFDGSGYPFGLVGDSIPIEARIVAVADVFDALLSKRPYKEPFSIEKTLQIIHEGSGSHFDPFIVETFDTVLDELLDVPRME